MQSNELTKQETIGGHTFFITKLTGSAGIDLLSDVLKAMGPAMGSLLERMRLGEMMAAKATGKSVAEVLAGADLSGIREAMKDLVNGLGKKEWRNIAEQALATTTCSTHGGKRVWDRGHAPLTDVLNFTAKQTMELVWVALNWHFADFFSGPSDSDSTQPAGPGSGG